MIRAIIPDEKLWHTQLKLESQASQERDKADYDGPGPMCCWYFCWWVH